MDYKKLSDCWNGIGVYNLNGDNKMFREDYDYNPVTMPYSQYIKYLESGWNAFDATGGVATGQVFPGGVIDGPVRQNFQTAASANIATPVPSQTSGLSLL